MAAKYSSRGVDRCFKKKHGDTIGMALGNNGGPRVRIFWVSFRWNSPRNYGARVLFDAISKTQ